MTESQQMKGQSQKHGFNFENEIKTKVFGLQPTSNDTDTHDVNCGLNKYDNNENVSIKISGGNNIDCADIIRFYSYDFSQKNTIIAGFYTQITSTEKKITSIIELDYNEKLHNILFGGITLDELNEYVNLVKSIPHGKNTDKTYLQLKKNLQKKIQYED